MPRWPDNIRPASIDWWLETHTIVHESPLSRATQTLELPGARWRVSMTFDNLLRAEILTLSGFVAGLRGPAGRVSLWPMMQRSVLKGITADAFFGSAQPDYPAIDAPGGLAAGSTQVTLNWTSAPTRCQRVIIWLSAASLNR